MLSAVVTGAASGIGRSIAMRLARDGWLIVGVDHDSTGLETAIEEIRQRGLPAYPMVGNVADRETHRSARRLAAEHAPLGAWVGAAGVTRAGELSELDEAATRLLVDVNALGLLWGAGEAVGEWLATSSGGVFVAISSVHGRHAFPDHAAYEMTKAAAEALVRNIAVTYGPKRIRAVAVAPGAVKTPALDASLNTAPSPDAARDYLARQSPAGRIADPTEIAAAVSFLVSDQASYISGTTLTVDGGWSAVLSRPPEDPSASRPASL